MYRHKWLPSFCVHSCRQLPSLLDLILAQVSAFTTGDEFAALTQSASLSHDTSTLFNPHALPTAEGLCAAATPTASVCISLGETHEGLDVFGLRIVQVGSILRNFTCDKANNINAIVTSKPSLAFLARASVQNDVTLFSSYS